MDDLERLIDNLEKDYKKVAAPPPPADPLQKTPDEHLFAARLGDIIIAFREIRRRFWLQEQQIVELYQKGVVLDGLSDGRDNV